MRVYNDDQVVVTNPDLFSVPGYIYPYNENGDIGSLMNLGFNPANCIQIAVLGASDSRTLKTMKVRKHHDAGWSDWKVIF